MQYVGRLTGPGGDGSRSWHNKKQNAACRLGGYPRPVVQKPVEHIKRGLIEFRRCIHKVHELGIKGFNAGEILLDALDQTVSAKGG